MLFTDLSRKFKFSAQDSDMEYLCWQCKDSPVSSDLKPPVITIFTPIPHMHQFWFLEKIDFCVKYLYVQACTIATIASLLCTLQILVGLEFRQSIRTVAHTIRELQQ